MSAKPSSSTAGAQPTHEQITERARKLWMERGSPGGRDREHWLEAEQQLRNEAAGKARSARPGKDLDEAEKRLDGLIEQKPSQASRTPDGEQL